MNRPCQVCARKRAFRINILNWKAKKRGVVDGNNEEKVSTVVGRGAAAAAAMCGETCLLV